MRRGSRHVVAVVLLLMLLATREASSTPEGHATELLNGAVAADPLERLLLARPALASVHKSPVSFLFEVAATEFDAYKAVYELKWVCVQVDGRDSACVPLIGSELLHLRLPVGKHSARAFIADTEEITPETERRHISDAISFMVLGSREFAEYGRRHLELERARIGSPSDQGLLEWASAESSSHLGPSNSSQMASCLLYDQPRPQGNQTCVTGPSRSGRAQPIASMEPSFLVIGVKTSLVDGFPFRQAIRQTWASPTSLPPGVKVLFAGCRPVFHPDHAPNYPLVEVNDALELEKRVFGDLLTSELDCDDGYPHLANKVKQFMHYAATHERYRLAKYVMIADDDIYLRISVLTAELRQLGEPTSVYAGSSRAKHFLRPIRDDRLRNFVSESVYPMDEFPPFALGPHYLLSMDCVQFIAENRNELQGLGVLDDVSVALWLLVIQVHPQHIDLFRSLCASRCQRELLSLADLSPLAMRLIHENLRQGLGLCHGLDQNLWDKSNVGRESYV